MTTCVASNIKRKAMKKNRLYFLLVLALLIHAPAHAHPPYLLKQGVITDPDGNPVITEKLYGDGVLFIDPRTFQLRNRHGALLANSPIEDHVASFCPSINFCWVFPYHALSLFAVGWSLDTEALVFDKPAPNYEFKDAAQAEAFKSYLHDKNVKRFSAYALGYPEFNRSHHSGFKPSGISALFSPFIIMADQFIQLLVFLLSTLVLCIIFRPFSRRKKIKRKKFKYLFYITYALFVAVYVGFYALGIFIMAFTLQTPWIYMLLFILAGISVILFLESNKISKDKKA